MIIMGNQDSDRKIVKKDLGKNPSRTVKDLDVKVADLAVYFTQEIEGLKQDLDRVKTPEASGERSDQEADTQALVHRLNLLEATVKNSLRTISEEIGLLKKTGEEVDSIEQRLNNNSILINGMSEEEGEDLYVKVITFVKSRLEIDITKSDIQCAYRFGRKKTVKGSAGERDRHRPVCVDFANRWLKNEVYYKKRALKGTKLVITELLSPRRYELYKHVRDRLGKENCWTAGGRIGFVKDGKREIVTNLTQFKSKYKAEVETAGTSTVNNRAGN